MPRSALTGYDAGDNIVRLTDSVADKDVSLGSGASLERALVGHTAGTLLGSVRRDTTSFTIEVDWERKDGTTLFTETIATGVAAGTKEDFSVPARSTHARVRVKDAGSGSGTVDFTIRMV